MHQRRVWRVVVAIAMVVAGSQGAAQEQSVTFTTIDFPGSISTNAQGINANGEIVGFYTDTAGRVHGFLRSGENYRSIDFPGARSTTARGIGPAGDIVGTYQRPDEPSGVHGFLMTKHGDLFWVDYPGHQNTIPPRILPDGTILGCYHDTDTMGTMHGMAVSRRGFEEIAESRTMHNGATPDGKFIVGLFTDMADNRGKGYTYDGITLTPFEVPGAALTAAWDVNPSGVIVGVYQDSAGRFHGFRYDGQAFASVDVPGSRATRVFGINAGGDMVGAFVDAAGRTHGFLATLIP
jgi:probable HAF family extracellular repeat protein